MLTSVLMMSLALWYLNSVGRCYHQRGAQHLSNCRRTWSSIDGLRLPLRICIILGFVIPHLDLSYPVDLAVLFIELVVN